MYIKRCILRYELKSIYLNIFNNNNKYFILLLFKIIKFLFEILLINRNRMHLIDFSDLEICWQNHILNSFSFNLP